MSKRKAFTMRVDSAVLREFDKRADDLGLSRNQLMERIMRLSNSMTGDSLFEQELEGWLEDVMRRVVDRAGAVLSSPKEVRSVK